MFMQAFGDKRVQGSIKSDIKQSFSSSQKCRYKLPNYSRTMATEIHIRRMHNNSSTSPENGCRSSVEHIPGHDGGVDKQVTKSCGEKITVVTNVYIFRYLLTVYFNTELAMFSYNSILLLNSPSYMPTLNTSCRLDKLNEFRVCLTL